MLIEYIGIKYNRLLEFIVQIDIIDPINNMDIIFNNILKGVLGGKYSEVISLIEFSFESSSDIIFCI